MHAHTYMHTHIQVCFANNAGFDLAFAVHDCNAGMLSPYTSSPSICILTVLKQNPILAPFTVAYTILAPFTVAYT